MTFGEKLQALRKQQGVSQENLASQINVSRQAISKWELDSSLPDIENVIQLSKIFDVSIDYLLKANVQNAKENLVPITNKKQKHIFLLGVACVALSFF